MYVANLQCCTCMYNNNVYVHAYVHCLGTGCGVWGVGVGCVFISYNGL